MCGVLAIRREARLLQGEAVPVVFACSDLARKIMGASEALAQGMNPNVIGKELKLWPASSKDSILGAARRLGPKGARALFDECVAADRASKSSSVDLGLMCERLMLSFIRASR